MEKFFVYCATVEYGTCSLLGPYATFEEAADIARNQAKARPEHDYYVLTSIGKYRGSVKIDERRNTKFMPDHKTVVRKKSKGK